MSPTVFREGPFRFYFFSREETRLHVHVYGPDGEAKFWLAPVRLERSHAFSRKEIRRIQALAKQHEQHLLESWNEFFND